jgi:hypothetical protein
VRANSHCAKYASRTAWKYGLTVHAGSANRRSVGLLSSPFGFRIQDAMTVDGIRARSEDSLTRP